MKKQMVKREGNKLSLEPQGPGGIAGMGAGEKQLWSLFGVLGLPPEQLQEQMDKFIEPQDESR